MRLLLWLFFVKVYYIQKLSIYVQIHFLLYGVCYLFGFWWVGGLFFLFLFSLLFKAFFILFYFYLLHGDREPAFYSLPHLHFDYK